MRSKSSKESKISYTNNIIKLSNIIHKNTIKGPQRQNKTKQNKTTRKYWYSEEIMLKNTTRKLIHQITKTNELLATEKLRVNNF